MLLKKPSQRICRLILLLSMYFFLYLFLYCLITTKGKRPQYNTTSHDSLQKYTAVEVIGMYLERFYEMAALPINLLITVCHNFAKDKSDLLNLACNDLKQLKYSSFS